ncbi:MAG: DNA polymerase III subunit delta [Chthoniobacterales bacterium]|nr:DNA polymerase III subunit delta [Chthoniobacterales bacterium]
MPAKPKNSAQATAIHLVAGNDEMAVKSRAKELAAELAPAEGGEFSLETLDAHADNAEHAASIIREAILSLSMSGFLSSEKLVWLKSANFLSDTQLGGSKSVLEALEELQKVLEGGIPEGTRFLFSAISPDKRRTFYKYLTKLAATDIMDKPGGGPRFDEDEAARQAATGAARERKLKFQTDALERFAAYVGSDTRQVLNELDKIDTYLGDERREIREEDIALLVPETRRGIIFELGNCLARRNLQSASNCLQKLLAQGEEPVGLLYAAIMPTIQRMTAAAVLIEEYGLRVPPSYPAFQSALEQLPEEAKEILPRKKDGTLNAYGFYLSAQEAKRFKARELADATIACAEATTAIMSTGSDPALILQQLLVRILTPR